MTEQEEDEELLTDLNQGKKNMVVFDESPAYIKVRSFTHCLRNNIVITLFIARKCESLQLNKYETAPNFIQLS